MTSGMFLSPRLDLTVRNLTSDQAKAIANAAVDIVGGVVSFSESAIYESAESTIYASEETTKTEITQGLMQCSRKFYHEAHSWGENEKWACQGLSYERTGRA